MRILFTNAFSWILTIALAMFMNCAVVHAHAQQKHDTIIYSPLKKKVKKSPLNFSLPPIKPGVISTAKVVVPRVDDKLLSDVEVYPNPITDQINMKYYLSRNA